MADCCCILPYFFHLLPIFIFFFFTNKVEQRSDKPLQKRVLHMPPLLGVGCICIVAATPSGPHANTLLNIVGPALVSANTRRRCNFYCIFFLYIYYFFVSNSSTLTSRGLLLQSVWGPAQLYHPSIIWFFGSNSSFFVGHFDCTYVCAEANFL